MSPTQAFRLSPHLSCTDLGNADRLIHLHGEDLRFCHDIGSWRAWDGARWCDDQSDTFVRRAARAVSGRILEEADAAAEEHQKKMREFAKSSANVAKIRAMIEAARVDERVVCSSETFDTHPDFLVAENGVVDLRTGKLTGHDRALLLTQRTHLAYDPTARCPRFDHFVLEVMDGDKERAAYLQRALGYSLTGHTTEQVMFLLAGPGSNGKTTLLEVVRKAMGDYGLNSAADTLMERKPGSPSNDLVRLRSKRFVTAAETREGRRLDEARVKSLSGGDTVTARLLFKEFIDFAPIMKLWLGTNHLPTIHGTDWGIWRRMVVLEFRRIFGDDEKDPNLATTLETELPGILAWLVQGAQNWYANGLCPPQSVLEAAASYRRAEDILGQFLEEACEVAPGAATPAGALHSAYRRWAELNGYPPMTAKALGQRLDERGFVARRTAQTRMRTGLRIVHEGPNLNGI